MNISSIVSRCALAALVALSVAACDSPSPTPGTDAGPPGGDAGRPGSGSVVYNAACSANCPSTGQTATQAVQFCDLDGQDPATLSAVGVEECVYQGEEACPDITCACAVERTSTPCEP